MEFDCTVEYKRGKENIAADAMSRSVHSEPEAMLGCHVITLVVPQWLLEIKNSYEVDAVYQQLKTMLQTETVPGDPYTLESEILKYKGRIMVGQNGEMRKKIFNSFRSSRFGDILEFKLLTRG